MGSAAEAAGSWILRYHEMTSTSEEARPQRRASSPLPAAASRDEGGAWRMDLQQYAALNPAQRLSLLLGQLGGDSLAADLSQHVAPFLSRLGTTGGGGGEQEAAADPQLVLRQVRDCVAGCC